MTEVYFITHPDVVKDPALPVPRWPLSARGQARMTAMLAQPWVRGLGVVYCSDEQKALDGAGILAEHLGLSLLVRPELGEIDRSSTGYLPEKEHAVAARLLFERPDESIRGWETARHAQARIIQAVETVLEIELLRKSSVSGSDDIAIVAHGAVGTLYLLHLMNAPIAFHHLQPGRDGGHYFCFDAATRTLHHEWRRIDPD